MIAALYSSPDRSKKFVLERFTFGWTAIEHMFTREVERAKNGIRRKIPGLKESYVKRDIWTRLNVKPAKIMQVLYCRCHYLLLILVNMVTIATLRTG